MKTSSRQRLIAAVFGIWAAEAAIAQDISRPDFQDTQDFNELRELIDRTVNFSMQNQDAKLTDVPPEIAARFFDELNSATVTQWILNWSESEWQSHIENLESIGFAPPSGVDQQPIEPEKAAETYGSASTAAIEWKSRVADWETANENSGRKTCKAALSALYIRACSDPTSCEIEQEYADTCVREHNDASDATSCVEVVSDYANSCFKGGGLPGFNFLEMLSGGGSAEVPLCNVASFSYRDEIAFATAAHCVPEQEAELVSRFHGAEQVLDRFIRSEEEPFSPSGDFAFLQGEEAPQILASGRFALTAAEAQEFVPTMFAGNNGLAFLANQVSEVNDLSGRFRLYWVDTSPLCTVVDYDASTGEMLHTCQTTKGGSGGMLIQKHEEEFVIVGINTGPSVDNDNVSNIAQFASRSAF